MSKVLSIFVDESGTVQVGKNNSRLYLTTLIFHDQRNNISNEIKTLERQISYIGINNFKVFHSCPIIRYTGNYRNVEIKERAKLFNTFFNFARNVNLSEKTFIVVKKYLNTKIEVENNLYNEIKLFINENIDKFKLYNRVIIYYDNGQKELSKILNKITELFPVNCEIRIVKPEDYYLLQVADLLCTLELLNYKTPKLNKAEIKFFGNSRKLYRNYLKYLETLRF